MDGSSQALNNNSSSTTTANMRAPVLIQPSNISSTVHPINTIFSARSHGMHNNSSTRTADNPIMTQPSNNSSTGYPPQNIVLTQPSMYNSHLYNAAEVSESNA